MHANQNQADVPAVYPVSVRMNRMTQLLKSARPRTDAEALRLLRGAFPGSSLAERVAAIARVQD